MLKKIQSIIVALAISVGIGAAALAPAAHAAPSDEVKKGVTAIGGNSSTTDPADIIALIVKVLLFIIGAVAVIMIIIGGIRYTISQGDSSAVTGAKNTILYAVIGVVVAILAYAVIHYVIGALATPSGTASE